MTDRDFLIWLAGFIDGDGCLSISHARSWRATKYLPIITVTQANRTILDECQRRTGLGTVTGPYYYKTWVSWHWSVRGRQALLLAQWLPLIVKRPQAEIFRNYDANKGAAHEAIRGLSNAKV